MAPRSRQVERTRGWILDAFSTLLAQVPYDDIRISHIADAAGVSRQSFYRLFGHKDRLLSAYFDRLFDEFEQEARRHFDEGEASAYRALFRTLNAHADELRVFGQPKLRAVLFEALWGYQARLLRYALADEPQPPDPLRSAYLVKYQSGGIAALVMEWVEQDMIVPPDEIADTVADVAAAFRDQRQFLPTLLAKHQDVDAAPGPGTTRDGQAQTPSRPRTGPGQATNTPAGT